MASGKHIGKVVIDVQDDSIESKKNSSNKTSHIPGVCRVGISGRHVYVITGGLGGLGLELTEWLVSRGAKHIVLTSRRGATTAYQVTYANNWNNL